MSVNTLILPLTLALMMLVVGSGLEPGHFRPLWQRPKATLTGLAAQLFLLPALAWALIVLLQLGGSLAAALILIAAAPGGATSNLFSHLARGDVALSVALTGIMSLLAPFWMPWAVQLQLGWLGSSALFRLSWLQSVLQLLLVTALPLLLGMLWRHLNRRWVLRNERKLKTFALVTLFLMIVTLVASNATALSAGITTQAVLLVILLACLALTSGYALARLCCLSQIQARTLSFETGVQNAGIAMLVAFTQLDLPAAGLVALLYGLLMNIPALLALWLFNAKAGKYRAISS